MNEQSKPKEWVDTDKLPEEFSDWFNDTLYEIERKRGKGLTNVASELGVDQNLLVRWMAGKCPLNQDNIRTLGDKLGADVYMHLGLDIPE